MPKLIDLTGQRFGRLVVVRRAQNIATGSGWLARCDCGTEVVVRACKLRGDHTKSCGCLRADTCRNLQAKDVVDYAGAHERVIRSRGPAKTHRCIDCGDVAQSWSYDRLDPNELYGQNAYGRGLAYSLDLSHYHPRCKPCHASFDAPSTKECSNAH